MKKLLVKIPIVNGKIVREEELIKFLELQIGWFELLGKSRGDGRSEAEAIVQDVLKVCCQVGKERSGDLIRVFFGENGVEFEVCWGVKFGEEFLNNGVNFEVAFKRGVEGDLFVVRDGELFVKNVDRVSVMSYFLQKYAEEILTVYEVKDFDYFLIDDEIMIVDDWHGVVSVRRIGELVLGNSRFWARKLRKIVKINWVK